MHLYSHSHHADQSGKVFDTHQVKTHSSMDTPQNFNLDDVVEKILGKFVAGVEASSDAEEGFKWIAEELESEASCFIFLSFIAYIRFPTAVDTPHRGTSALELFQT